MSTTNKLLKILNASVRKFSNKITVQFVKIRQGLGFTSKIYNYFKPQFVPVYTRKGHTLVNPTDSQISAINLGIVRKMRIEQWVVLDNLDLYEYEDPSENIWLQRPESIIDKIILSATDSNNWSAANLYKLDISKDNSILENESLPGISCHLFVNSSGVVERTSSYSNKIYHTPANNLTSLNMTIQYLMTHNSSSPTRKIIMSLERILTMLCLEFKLNPYKAILGQREARFTWLPFTKGRKKFIHISPGYLVSIDAIRREVAIMIQRKLAYLGLYNSEINGKFDRVTKKALREFNSESLKGLYSKLEIMKGV